jgi:hypothetical protein
MCINPVAVDQPKHPVCTRWPRSNSQATAASWNTPSRSTRRTIPQHRPCPASAQRSRKSPPSRTTAPESRLAMLEQNLARLVEDMPDDELRAARHDAAVGLSLLRPGSALYGPAQAYLGLLDAELAQRHGTGQAANPST